MPFGWNIRKEINGFTEKILHKKHDIIEYSGIASQQPPSGLRMVDHNRRVGAVE